MTFFTPSRIPLFDQRWDPTSPFVTFVDVTDPDAFQKGTQTESFVGRVSYTNESNSSAAVESVVGQNGDGLYVKGEYLRASGQHHNLLTPEYSF